MPRARRTPKTQSQEEAATIAAAVTPAIQPPVVSPTDDSVAARAYRLFEARGRQHGHDVADWLEAEREMARATTE
jgi:hypothetical protein